MIEKYENSPGSNGTFEGNKVLEKNTEKEITGCTECLATRNAYAIRTEYDKYFMEIYNNKAQNFETDLLELQFPTRIRKGNYKPEPTYKPKI